MSWIVFLKNKNEILYKFKEFKLQTETETGLKIKCLRSDNGLEYTSTEFNNFCSQEGIRRQLTVPYSPQQNEVSERKNRTVVEMGRSMMMDKNLPLMFWAEAARTAVYLLNRLPSRALKETTAYEAWYGTKPTTSHLNFFCSICYCHIPEDRRKELEKKAEIGILLGYSSEAKRYRIYNVISTKVIIRRDVVVDELGHWNWEAKRIESYGSHEFQNTIQRQGENS